MTMQQLNIFETYSDTDKEWRPSPCGDDKILMEHYLLIGTGGGAYYSTPRDPERRLTERQKEHLRKCVGGEKLIWMWEADQCSEDIERQIEAKLREVESTNAA